MVPDNTGVSDMIDMTGETRVVRGTTKLEVTTVIQVTGSKKAGKVRMMNVDTSAVTLANSIVTPIGRNDVFAANRKVISPLLVLTSRTELTKLVNYISVRQNCWNCRIQNVT